MEITFDIEANNLLNEDSIDYEASPFKLKDTFKTHSIVVEEHLTGKLVAFYDGDKILLDGRTYEGDGEYTTTLEGYPPVEYEHFQLGEFRSYVENNPLSVVVGHNIINFDLLLCKLQYGMDYEVEPDSWCGKEVRIDDTMVISKTQNADRFGGHSLDNLGKKVGLRKVEFRKELKPENRFKVFAPDMLYYNIVDVRVNTKVHKYLKEEAGTWDWQDSLSLEKAVAEIVTRQEHRGFDFNRKLADECVAELDLLKEEAKAKVEPVLPNKTPTKKFLGDVTPPSEQFKKDGKRNVRLEKFVAKHGGEFIKVKDTGLDSQDYQVKLFGKVHSLPIPSEPMITEVPCGIDDTTPIKEWLVGLGWIPSEWNERDLTMYADKKKGKLPPDKFKDAVDRYVDQTLNSTLKKERCGYIRIPPSQLKDKLLSHDTSRPLKVATNPKFTKGQDKEICPNLEKLSETFPYATDIVKYLTYKHRRNSILGGGLDWEDGEEAEKGYLAFVRKDGRIPTPADTCGAATSRFTHRVVANIPRNTSLYGDKMRALFGVSKGFFQLGYDFDSLEAKIEADAVYKYPGGKEYGYSLTAEKPNDCHSTLARELTEILGYEFSRGNAKNVKYGCSYNAQPARIAKTVGCSQEVAKVVFDTFWNRAYPLKVLKERMVQYWETKGEKKFLLGLDGRKLPVRSKGNVINTRFQSSGVICAKRAMVIHDRKLKAEGMSVDFFKDDWKTREFCQQLIAYHDEAQLEVSSSMVKFKTFEEKEDAIAWKKRQEDKTGKRLSDVGHINGKWYVGYCRAGELAVEAVKEAGEYYKLNVELTAGYMLGDSWSTCH